MWAVWMMWMMWMIGMIGMMGTGKDCLYYSACAVLLSISSGAVAALAGAMVFTGFFVLYGVGIKLRLVKWFDAIGEQHRRIAQES